MRLRTLSMGLAAAGLSGCHGERPSPVSTPPEAYVQAEDVMRQIKSELRDYSVYQAASDRTARLPNACGGALTFDIKSVTVTLNVVTQVSAGGEVSAKVPIGGFELGPNLSTTDTRKASQKITFTLEPVDDPADRSAAVPAPTAGSFYAALRGLREGLLNASGERPCFTFPKEQKNSVESAFQVVQSSSAKFGVTFLIFSVGTNSSKSLDATNTISIAFNGQGVLVRNPDTGRLERSNPYLNGAPPPGVVIRLPAEGAETPPSPLLPRSRRRSARPRPR